MKSIGAMSAAMPLPAWIVAAYDKDGRANAMAASWTGVCNSDPPSLYFSARQSRYTFDCVVSSRAFTVHIPGEEQAALTDYLGIVSGKRSDKLSAVQCESTSSELVHAPILTGFPIVMECKLSTATILGSHTIFIGEIVDTKCDESFLGDDGKPVVDKIRPFVYCMADGAYYSLGRQIGMGYNLGKGLADSSG